MFQGELVDIFVTARKGEPMQSIGEARVVLGHGLEGDRYFSSEGTSASSENAGREITLIASEAIAGANREYDLEVSPVETRRNLLTRDVPLNHLVGREFKVGDVTLRGIRLCEPCGHLENLTCRGIKKALVHRGGLRAAMLTEGTVKAGDVIRPSE